MTARVHPGATVSIDVALPRNLHWMDQALCLRKGVKNFYLPGRPTQSDYQRIKDQWCNKCPVRSDCLVTVIRQETKARYTSRGVQGGATPAERHALRRKIRDSRLCTVEGVWRWLHGLPLPRVAPPPNRLFKVTLTDPLGVLVYQNSATTPKGAHLIAVREQRRNNDELLGTVTCREGHVIEVLPPIGRGKPQMTPCPEL